MKRGRVLCIHKEAERKGFFNLSNQGLPTGGLPAVPKTKEIRTGPFPFWQTLDQRLLLVIRLVKILIRETAFTARPYQEENHMWRALARGSKLLFTVLQALMTSFFTLYHMAQDEFPGPSKLAQNTCCERPQDSYFGSLNSICARGRNRWFNHDDKPSSLIFFFFFLLVTQI